SLLGGGLHLRRIAALRRFLLHLLCPCHTSVLSKNSRPRPSRANVAHRQILSSIFRSAQSSIDALRSFAASGRVPASAPRKPPHSCCWGSSSALAQSHQPSPDSRRP